MTWAVANTELTNTFDNWRLRTNDLADAMSNVAITVDSNNAVGNAEVTGSFGATTLYANAITGGVIGAVTVLTITSNTLHGAQLAEFNANTKFSGANNFLGLAANLEITSSNATHNFFRANNSTNKMYFSQANTSDIADLDKSGIANNYIFIYNNVTENFEVGDASSLAGVASITVSNTAPGGPAEGALWWNEITGTLMIYYDDVDSSQWVEAISNYPDLSAYYTKTQSDNNYYSKATANSTFVNVAGDTMTANLQVSATINATSITINSNDVVANTRLVSTGNGLSGGGDLSANRTLSVNTAITATYDVNGTFTKAQRGSVTTLTSGTTVTPNFNDNNFYSLAIAHNATLANPTNITVGQSGCIFITQQTGAPFTLAYGGYWKFVGGTAPTLSTANQAVDRLDYIVKSTTEIHASIAYDVK
jgi:hypothetical protein